MDTFSATVAACLCLFLSQAAATLNPHQSQEQTHNHVYRANDDIALPVENGSFYYESSTTPEPKEHEAFTFNYVPNTQKMVLHISKLCYVVTLSTNDTVRVHTDSGLRDLELMILNNLDGAKEVTKDMLDLHERSKCSKHTEHYYTLP